MTMSLTGQPMSTSESKTLNLHHIENYFLTLNHRSSEPFFRPPINSLFQPEHVLLTSACVSPMKSKAILRHFEMYSGVGGGGVHCGDDLILGSPDQQDWSLIPGGRGKRCVNRQRRHCSLSQRAKFILIRCVTFSDADFMTNVRINLSVFPTHLISCSALLRFMYRLTVC